MYIVIGYLITNYFLNLNVYKYTLHDLNWGIDSRIVYHRAVVIIW
jgi:hypothetical protein